MSLHPLPGRRPTQSRERLSLLKRRNMPSCNLFGLPQRLVILQHLRPISNYMRRLTAKASRRRAQHRTYKQVSIGLYAELLNSHLVSRSQFATMTLIRWGGADISDDSSSEAWGSSSSLRTKVGNQHQTHITPTNTIDRLVSSYTNARRTQYGSTRTDHPLNPTYSVIDGENDIQFGFPESSLRLS